MKLLLPVFALLFIGIAATQTKNLTTEQLEKYLEKKDGIFFLDVREPDEIAKLGSVPGYVNIPIGQLEKRLNEVPKDKLIITMCNRAVRAARAEDILAKSGHKTIGSCGLNEYKEKGKKLVYPNGDKK